MSEGIYWISVDTDVLTDEEQLDKIGKAIEEQNFDEDFIISTDVIEPLHREEIREYLSDIVDFQEEE